MLATSTAAVSVSKGRRSYVYEAPALRVCRRLISWMTQKKLFEKHARTWISCAASGKRPCSAASLSLFTFRNIRREWSASKQSALTFERS